MLGDTGTSPLWETILFVPIGKWFAFMKIFKERCISTEVLKDIWVNNPIKVWIIIMKNEICNTWIFVF